MLVAVEMERRRGGPAGWPGGSRGGARGLLRCSALFGLLGERYETIRFAINRSQRMYLEGTGVAQDRDKEGTINNRSNRFIRWSVGGFGGLRERVLQCGGRAEIQLVKKKAEGARREQRE